MTDREKAIVMAYTGVCMLKGDKLDVFYDYVEAIMGGPVATLDAAILGENIKHRAEPDFLRLCAEDGHARWALNEDGLWACTNCEGLAIQHPDEPEKWQAHTEFCPNCGYKMDGGAEECR